MSAWAAGNFAARLKQQQHAPGAPVPKPEPTAEPAAAPKPAPAEEGKDESTATGTPKSVVAYVNIGPVSLPKDLAQYVSTEFTFTGHWRPPATATAPQPVEHTPAPTPASAPTPAPPFVPSHVDAVPSASSHYSNGGYQPQQYAQNPMYGQYYAMDYGMQPYYPRSAIGDIPRQYAMRQQQSNYYSPHHTAYQSPYYQQAYGGYPPPMMHSGAMDGRASRLQLRPPYYPSQEQQQQQR